MLTPGESVGVPATVTGDAVDRDPQVVVFRTSYLYQCNRIEGSPLTARPAAAILLATSRRDFGIEVDGQIEHGSVAIVRPFVAKRVRAADVPLISFGLHPNHTKYRAFIRLADPGVVTFPRGAFAALEDAAAHAVTRRITPAAGARLLETALDTLLPHLPEPPPLDPRVKQVMKLLVNDATIPLDVLAEATCLSYFRLSHLFTQQIGISLRQYVLSLKVDAACQHLGLAGTLTDAAHAAGFCDSAHLSKVWVKWFGGPPTYFMRKGAYATDPTLG